MKKLVILVMIAVAMMSVTSCNMLHGAGEDVEAAGDAISDAAD